MLERWIDPAKFGWYSGDHHIHAAGCAHYTSPTEGVYPQDMFLHVKGEAPQRRLLPHLGPVLRVPAATSSSRPPTRSASRSRCLKYDIEVSGFGSQAARPRLLAESPRPDDYPGADGTKTKGWPTWTTPVMSWTKLQGGFTGYAHSANGLQVNAQAAAKRMIDALDANKDGKLSQEEAAKGLLPSQLREDRRRRRRLSDACRIDASASKGRQQSCRTSTSPR